MYSFNVSTTSLHSILFLTNRTECGVKEAALPKWVGFIQSMEGLNRTSETGWVRENFTCLIDWTGTLVFCSWTGSWRCCGWGCGVGDDLSRICLLNFLLLFLFSWDVDMMPEAPAAILWLWGNLRIEASTGDSGEERRRSLDSLKLLYHSWTPCSWLLNILKASKWNSNLFRPYCIPVSSSTKWREW